MQGSNGRKGAHVDCWVCWHGAFPGSSYKIQHSTLLSPFDHLLRVQEELSDIDKTEQVFFGAGMVPSQGPLQQMPGGGMPGSSSLHPSHQNALRVSPWRVAMSDSFYYSAGATLQMKCGIVSAVCE